MGNIIFDPFGGGNFVGGSVVNGGHVWFPTYETVKLLLDRSSFEKYKFYHYYNERGESITKEIDYSIGYIQRIPDHDDRVKSPFRAMSIVVDCYKK